MTQVVTVHTDFTDLNQMAQGLVGRVNETHVILPGPEPVEQGDWVEFAVTLYDGTPGFAGVGRCVTVVDNGEERLSHQRFDVVIDSLQFDSRGQQVFEHILTLHGVGGEYAGDEEGGAASDDNASYMDVSADFTGSARVEVPDLPPDGPTTVSEPSFEEQEAPRYVAPEEEPEDVDDEVVTVPPPKAEVEEPARESARPVYSEPPRAPMAAQVNGHVNGKMFAYHDGLPFPAKPPRPELDASLKVSPAPRPDSSSDAH